MSRARQDGSNRTASRGFICQKLERITEQGLVMTVARDWGMKNERGKRREEMRERARKRGQWCVLSRDAENQWQPWGGRVVVTARCAPSLTHSLWRPSTTEGLSVCFTKSVTEKVRASKCMNSAWRENGFEASSSQWNHDVKETFEVSIRCVLVT